MPLMTDFLVDLASVRDAAIRIAPFAHRTPVMTCATLDRLAGCELFFKCENFQRVGAFKFRGACNAVMKLSDEVAARGVVTHSSGNHAQALALAASIRGITAHIVMPRNAPKCKQEAVAGYGGKIYLCEPNLPARKALTAEVVAATGAELIPPYDHPDIIAGQGTIALELFEQVGGVGLDAIIVPVGGGGMTSGIALAAKSLDPSIRIIAAEPLGADDVARSLRAGVLIEQTSPNTIADGLLTSLSEITWSIIRENVERVITVREDEIIRAMRLVFERMKIVIEPSSAVAFAVAMSDEFRSLGLGHGGIRRAGVILSGGNVDLDKLPWM
ncbi:MAG TPA: pyridoxal-phosphate dependent enzyme [Phycisphaerales bacterium]|nr:pyridoxal-phosphate dependent enzyme [Phycisphaerales bacterium]